MVTKFSLVLIVIGVSIAIIMTILSLGFFAIWPGGSSLTTPNIIATRYSFVTIPNGTSSAPFDDSGRKQGYDPDVIKVVIGVNNTVRWINQDVVTHRIAADNENDPDFYNATKEIVWIEPKKTFEYTFTRVGEFGYHGAPWQRGAVIVIPPDRKRIQGSFDSTGGTLPCADPIESKYNGDTFYTCTHPPNFDYSSVVLNLPAPTFKQVRCMSTYGCSQVYHYIPQIPDNLLTTDQRQQVVDKAMLSLSEQTSDNKTLNWKLDHVIIDAWGDKYSANVQFVLDNIRRPADGGCGWYTSLQFDLETLKATNEEIMAPPESLQPCS